MTGVQRWKVEITPEAHREFVQLVKEGALANSDVEVIKKWVSEIEEYGLESIWKSSFWNDHELHSEWAGYRSSSFSYRGRLIYRVIKEKVVVEVVRITTVHDYRR